jgi:thiol-disulfide isomerase/thioredoxin
VPLLSRRTRPSVVTFVTRSGCHLCEVAEPVVRAAAQAAGARFELRDVDASEADRATWSDKVPVVLLDGREHAYWTVDERALRKALR